MKKLVRYDRRTFFQITTSELKDVFEAERKRLQNIKNGDRALRNKDFDTDLLVVVMLNHVTALLHFSEDKEKLERRLTEQTEKNNTLNVELTSSRVSSSSKDLGTSGGSFNLRKIEIATREIETSDE